MAELPDDLDALSIEELKELIRRLTDEYGDIDHPDLQIVRAELVERLRRKHGAEPA